MSCWPEHSKRRHKKIGEGYAVCFRWNIIWVSERVLWLSALRVPSPTVRAAASAEQRGGYKKGGAGESDASVCTRHNRAQHETFRGECSAAVCIFFSHIKPILDFGLRRRATHRHYDFIFHLAENFPFKVGRTHLELLHLFTPSIGMCHTFQIKLAARRGLIKQTTRLLCQHFSDDSNLYSSHLLHISLFKLFSSLVQIMSPIFAVHYILDKCINFWHWLKCLTSKSKFYLQICNIHHKWN
jgi:hypothetical protein